MRTRKAETSENLLIFIILICLCLYAVFNWFPEGSTAEALLILFICFVLPVIGAIECFSRIFRK